MACMCVCVSVWAGGGRGIEVLYRRLFYGVQTLYPFNFFFSEKGNPFIHLPCKMEMKVEILHPFFKTLFERHLQYSSETIVKCVRSITFVFTFLNYLYFNSRNLYPFIYYIPRARKMYPFWVEPPRIVHYGEYPPPPPPGVRNHGNSRYV